MMHLCHSAGRRRAAALLLPLGRRDFTHPEQEYGSVIGRFVSRIFHIIAGVALAGGLAACGDAELQAQRNEERRQEELEISDESFFDLFRNQRNPDQGVLINRFLWQASLDTLSFLPLDTADHGREAPRARVEDSGQRAVTHYRSLASDGRLWVAASGADKTTFVVLDRAP